MNTLKTMLMALALIAAPAAIHAQAPTEVPAAKATDFDQKYATDLLKVGAEHHRRQAFRAERPARTLCSARLLGFVVPRLSQGLTVHHAALQEVRRQGRGFRGRVVRQEYGVVEERRG